MNGMYAESGERVALTAPEESLACPVYVGTRLHVGMRQYLWVRVNTHGQSRVHFGMSKYTCVSTPTRRYIGRIPFE